MGNEQERPLGGLIVKLVLIGILVLLVVLLLMGVILGWFKKEETVKKPVLSMESVLLSEGEKYTIEISNYRALGEPSVKWAIEAREIATVKNNKDGTAEISAKSMGEATVTVKAEGCEEVQCRVVVKKAPIASIAGTAWETEDGDYYFLGDGDYYYFISPKTENYIKGSIQLKEMSKEDMENSEAAQLVNSVDRAAYFRMEALVDLETYYGSRRSGGKYVIYIAANETEAAIYDSGWSEALPAKKIELLQADALDAKFPGGAEVPVETAASAAPETPDSYSFASVDFTRNGIWKESLNAIQIGSELVFKRGDGEHNALYRMPLDGSSQAGLLYQPQDGKIVTVFGTDGKQLIFGVGDAENGAYGTDTLYRMDLNGGAPVLLVQDAVSDFCVIGDTVYYTDYTRLVRLSMNGRTEVLWEYGVYCYDITDENLVFLFDGDAWELLDAETGEDFGYLCEGCNYAYECDFAQQVGDYLYYVAYDYNTEQVSLRALNIWNGTEAVIGEAYDGTTHDTYCVQFYSHYAIFTVGDGESIVRIDLSSGKEEQVYLEDVGYWYTNEIVLVDGAPMLYLYDDDQNGWYATMDDSMNLIPVTSGQ